MGSSSPLYERLCLAPLIDLVCGLPVLARQRREVVPLAEGVVLEPGIGSGHNLVHYDPARVCRVIGVDPSAPLLARAARRAARAPFAVETVEGSAEALPLDDRSVDTVLLTYTGCSIPDIRAALAEFRRVLKPSGRLLFLEHGRAPEPRVARFQERIEPLWARLAGGCHLTRDICTLLAEAGFGVAECRRFYALPRPKFVTFHYVGAARVR